MWQRTAVWIVCIHATLALHAEESSSPWSLADLPATLLAQDTRLRFEVVSGRIAVRTVHVGTKSRVHAEHTDGQHQELLCYMLGDTSLSLRYETRTPQARMVLEVPNADQLSLLYESRAGHQPARVTYCQCGGRVQLIVVGPDGERRYEHTSLWHLLFEQPELSRAYVLPLLSRCRSSWDLEAQWAELREVLRAQAGSVSLPTRNELMTWVRQLSSPQRKDRRVAMRRLQRVGQPLLAFLDTLDPRQLDREQRSGIAQLRRTLEQQEIDTPRRVAARLAADARVWRALAFDTDVQIRTAAARQLEMLTGRASATGGYASSK